MSGGLGSARPHVVMWVCGALVGCTSLLGIDNEYTLGPSEDASTNQDGGSNAGGSHTGGTITTGGQGTGGATGGTGAAGSGGTTGGSGGANGGSGGITGGNGGATGGAGGIASCSTSADCAPDEKCCDICRKPEPIIGCSLTGCDVCPQRPDNGVVVCVNSECAVQCNPTFHLTADGMTCEPDAIDSGGGMGGTAGTGGMAGTGGAPSCEPSTCTNVCTIASPFQCCRSDGKCGCTWAGYCL